MRGLGVIAILIGGALVIALSVQQLAQTPDDPDDGLTVFWLGMSGVLSAMFGWAVVERLRGPVVRDEGLWRRLAPGAPTLKELQRQSDGPVFLLIGSVWLATLFMAYWAWTESTEPGGVPQVPDAAVIPGFAVTLGAAFVAMLLAVRSVGRSSMFTALGLRVTAMPRHTVFGSLVGKMRIKGRRHGRRITIEQGTRTARTQIEWVDASAREPPPAPADLRRLTGIDANWDDVEVRCQPDAIVVERRGNGAGRWLLADLLLAEQLG